MKKLIIVFMLIFSNLSNSYEVKLNLHLYCKLSVREFYLDKLESVFNENVIIKILEYEQFNTKNRNIRAEGGKISFWISSSPGAQLWDGKLLDEKIIGKENNKKHDTVDYSNANKFHLVKQNTSNIYDNSKRIVDVDFFTLDVNIDRNTGVFNYKVESNTLKTLANGYCEKVDLNKQKF